MKKNDPSGAQARNDIGKTMRRQQESRIIENTFYAQLAAFILTSLSSTIGGLVDGMIIGQ